MFRLTLYPSGRAPTNGQNSQAGGNPTSSQLEQWSRNAHTHEQVAMGQQASRPSEAEMRARLAELEHRSQGNGCNGNR